MFDYWLNLCIIKNMSFENFKKSIGLKSQSYRRSQGLTQEMLAEKIDCSVNYLSLVENGRKNISLKMFYRFLNALNIEASKIFDVED